MKKNVIIGTIIIMIIASFFSGCTTEEENNTPVIISFTANPNTIIMGLTGNLSWEIENADTVSIDNGVGTVGLKGTKKINPQINTTYTLTALKSGNNVTATAEVIVEPLPPLGITFSKNQTALTLTIQTVMPTDLTWDQLEYNVSESFSVINDSFPTSGLVTVGHTIQFSGNGTIYIRYKPADLLLAVFDFS